MTSFVAFTNVARSDLSIERVAALAQQNELPVPTLDLSALALSAAAAGGFSAFRNTPEMRAPAPTRAYTTDDPWSVTRPPAPPSITPNGTTGSLNGASAPSNIAGTGLPSNWWKKLESVTVNILGQQGFILNRYLVYEVSTEVRAGVLLCECRTQGYDITSARPTSASSLFGVRDSVGLSGEAISIQDLALASAETDRT